MDMIHIRSHPSNGPITIDIRIPSMSNGPITIDIRVLSMPIFHHFPSHHIDAHPRPTHKRGSRN